MIIFDLSLPRKQIFKIISSINENKCFKLKNRNHVIDKKQAAMLCTIVLSTFFKTPASAHGFENCIGSSIVNSEIVENYINANIFALCELIKQDRFYSIKNVLYLIKP